MRNKEMYEEICKDQMVTGPEIGSIWMLIYIGRHASDRGECRSDIVIGDSSFDTLDVTSQFFPTDLTQES